MASNLLGMASNLRAMASNLEAMASNLPARIVQLREAAWRQDRLVVSKGTNHAVAVVHRCVIS